MDVVPNAGVSAEAPWTMQSPQLHCKHGQAEASGAFKVWSAGRGKDVATATSETQANISLPPRAEVISWTLDIRKVDSMDVTTAEEAKAEGAPGAEDGANGESATPSDVYSSATMGVQGMTWTTHQQPSGTTYPGDARCSTSLEGHACVGKGKDIWAQIGEITVEIEVWQRHERNRRSVEVAKPRQRRGGAQGDGHRPSD